MLRMSEFDEEPAILLARLPHSLTELHFCDTLDSSTCSFDHSLDGLALPPALRMLTLSECFKQSLMDWRLLASLTVLHLGAAWNLPLETEFFPGLFNHLCGDFCFAHETKGFVIAEIMEHRLA